MDYADEILDLKTAERVLLCIEVSHSFIRRLSHLFAAEGGSGRDISECTECLADGPVGFGIVEWDNSDAHGFYKPIELPCLNHT